MAEPKKYFINNLRDDVASLDLALTKERTQGILNNVAANFKQRVENADGGLYVGLAGVSYMFYHLSKLPSFAANRQDYLNSAKKFLEIPLAVALKASSSRHITDKTGFLTGDVGVYAVAAVVYKRLGMEKESAECVSQIVEARALLMPLNWFRNGGDELFVGRAGYLCAILWLRRELGHEILPDAELEQMLNTMVTSGQQFASSVRSNFPLMFHYYGTQYLGAAHGLAGILFVLLCFPKWMEKNPEAKKLVRETVDCYLQLQNATGNFPCAMDEVGTSRRPVADELIHWCHGAPGAVYLMAKAYLVFKDQKYLQSALGCGEVTWQKGLLKKGPGICHGVAGSGYVFLLLHQLTGDPKHLNRAAQFLNFIYTPDFQRARQPDSPFSLYEGLAGTACFAADLTDPSRAQFPFFGLD